MPSAKAACAYCVLLAWASCLLISFIGGRFLLLTGAGAHGSLSKQVFAATHIYIYIYIYCSVTNSNVHLVIDHFLQQYCDHHVYQYNASDTAPLPTRRNSSCRMWAGVFDKDPPIAHKLAVTAFREVGASTTSMHFRKGYTAELTEKAVVPLTKLKETKNKETP